MNFRNICALLVTVCLIGLLFALLWVQGNLPTSSPGSPWDPHITFSSSLYTFWLPALYLFCSGIWFYLLWKFPHNRRIRAYWRNDNLSYGAVIVIFALQVNWQSLGDPAIWIRGALLLLICIKGAILFRMLYHEASLIRPLIIGVIGVGIHILLLPFRYQSLSLELPTLFRQTELFQLAILSVKIIGLNVMALETFRLARLFARSPQSAIFSWFVVTFTFPMLGYPKISHILAGLLLIFILRLIFSRLDTRELMLGLLTGPNSMILLKLTIVLMLIMAAGLIFWSNVKPGFGLHGGRAAQTAILAFLDAQAGLFCYTPLYWLSLFGMMYVVFFRVWDGVLLLLTGGIAYIGYHFTAFGILDRVIDPTVTVPFLPLFGVFMAIAHTRFGKMPVFRYLLRLSVLLTAFLTFLFLLLFPEFPHIQIKFAEIQRMVLTSSGLDLPALLPTSAFQPFSLKTFVWTGISLLLAIVFCMARTRQGYWLIHRSRQRSNVRTANHYVTFAPFVVLTCVLIGAGATYYHQDQHDLPLESPLLLSRLHAEETIVLDQPVRSRHIRIVSNLTGGAVLPQNTKIANITVFAREQRFETFTLKVGKDLADAMFERPDIRTSIAHGRATVFRSWDLDAGNGTTFAAHDYYTVLTLPRQLDVQKIVAKFVDPVPDEELSQIEITLEAITLIE